MYFRRPRRRGSPKELAGIRGEDEAEKQRRNQRRNGLNEKENSHKFILSLFGGLKLFFNGIEEKARERMKAVRNRDEESEE